MSASDSAASQSRDSLERARWISMGAVLIGTFMVSLDQSVTTIALPQIGSDLGDVANVDWTITAYLLALGVVQPVTGWLADRLGRKYVFLGSLVLFSVGSSLSALAPSLLTLVLARVVQGLGGGAIFPVGMAMVYEQFPPARRGMAMGVWSLGLTAAPAFGPSLGALILTVADWRWLFLINVPVGAIGVIAGARLLHLTGFRDERPFDGVGLGLVATGLGSMLLGLSEANTWGWMAAPTLGLFALGAALLLMLVRHELRVPEPLIDMRMFAIPAFSITMTIIAALVIVQFGRLVFLPLELEVVHGWDVVAVGLIMTPAALASALVAPLAGRIADRVGSRPPVLIGLGINGLGAWLLAGIGPATPPWLIGAMVAVQGLGSGLALTPNTVAGMNALPQRLLARGSAVRSTTRQVASSFGVAALTGLVVVQAGGLTPNAGADAATLQAAYNSVYLCGALIMLGCLALAVRLPNREQTRAYQQARLTEHERLVANADTQ